MSEGAGNGAGASRFWGGLNKFLTVVAVLSILGGSLAHFADWYQRSVTEPIAGYVYRRTVPESGGKAVQGEKGETIMKIEVRKPGPRTLENIQLEIDVPDKCHRKDGEFASGLIPTRGPKTDGADVTERCPYDIQDQAEYRSRHVHNVPGRSVFHRIRFPDVRVDAQAGRGMRSRKR